MRFLQNNHITVIKTSYNSYIIVTQNVYQTCIYKLPVGISEITEAFSFMHICLDTTYACVLHPIKAYTYNTKNFIFNKFSIQKPIYFSRFKYVGKGFKLLLKKKHSLLNCIFGYSHIYWVKIQNVLVKKTKKYKFGFASASFKTHSVFLQVLRKIKPINKYTLRGVRTYTHVWIKRKGRKSIATHI